MSNEVKVSASYITKRYELKKKKTLRERSRKSEGNDFWALRGISFEVMAGDAVGLIGTNGSGKSTLSNIIAGIATPTTGNLTVNGKTSMIAISSGLKKELTGLENIRLKCLLSGMTNRQIDEVTDDIIAFSELDDFIDQPLKNYSSGMRSRLGFAISVHSDPDILIVDEALSVGDKTFNRKCIDKINGFKSEGKTIFFVSHSLKAIENFCNKVIWIHDGEMKQFGPANEVVEAYQAHTEWFKSLSQKEQRKYKRSQKKARKEFDIDDYYQQAIDERAVEDQNRLKDLFYPTLIEEKLSFSSYVFIFLIVIALLLIAIHYIPSRSIVEIVPI